MTIDFVYALGETVEIPTIKTTGLIEGARVMGNGVYNPNSIRNEYCVAFWMNGERKSMWIIGTELNKL